MGFLMSCGSCCIVISFWGVIQLVLMGIFFKIEAVGLLHSVEAEEYENDKEFLKITKNNYSIVAINCFIAAAMYVVTAALSYMCIKQANKAEKKRTELLEDDYVSCRPDKKNIKSKPKQK